MSFKTKILYKMLAMGKKQFKELADDYSPESQTLEEALKIGALQRKRWVVFSKIISLLSSAPKNIKQETVVKGGVKCVITSPQDPCDTVILYIHGGYWVLHITSFYTTFAARLSNETKAKVWLVDYRLAPEHPFPAGLDDAFTVYKEMLKEGHDPKKIIVMGDSAGGNLTMALLLKLKKEKIPLPAAAIPLSPGMDFHQDGESFVTKAEVDPMLYVDPSKRILDFIYLRGASPDNPLVSPLLGNMKGLPPLLIMVGGKEVLLSDSVNLEEKARQAGVDVTLDVNEEMFHVYPIFYDFFDEAKIAMGKISLFIKSKTK
jgi:monoterpene epsilon-lactone hydrolase